MSRKKVGKEAPRAAPSIFPFFDHRTMATVMEEEYGNLIHAMGEEYVRLINEAKRRGLTPRRRAAKKRP